MKKLMFLGVATMMLATSFFISCEKEEVQSNNDSIESYNRTSENDFSPKAEPGGGWWSIFDKIRVHRGTTERNRDGKNCGCNECFGICNAPHGKQSIAIRQDSEDKATIVFLNEKPRHFEQEFGVDSDIKLHDEEENITYIISTGLYEAVDMEGQIVLRNQEVTYYGYVVVDLVN